MKKVRYGLPVLALVGALLPACEKVETTDRTIVVDVLHPEVLIYHLELRLDSVEQVIWDTTGNATVSISARSGDVLSYSMGTNAPGSQMKITVNGRVLLVNDLTGVVTEKAVAGSLLID